MDTLELPIIDGDTAPVEAAPSGWGPRARPPVASRLFVGLLGFGAILSTVALLLSDRAPGALSSMFGDRARRLWERIDASERVDLPPDSELPATDFLVHMSIWIVVTVLVGLAIWSWRGLALAAITLAVASVALELAQGRYADTRVVEARDAVANLLGIGVGLAVVVGCYLAWSAVASIVRGLRNR
ncbi:hypothetical protein [Ilumatobacter coccineus]|jgi:hypothetical protein|uniref:VanZ-like domain-containing protein n=1 Tax=Ilumatobacter coccineus (strain NBRC 103263 / KCTC 29153 / YM16-304) TaxID=1313172 RepID=A0A6C7E4Y5_ILUCY|nr:hypothetical protein [Ilumatobacter coccineus]BAN00399.1 hypothetical protein YM304_00850 [Ilumatobacter coccineus YM16-304]